MRSDLETAFQGIDTGEDHSFVGRYTFPSDLPLFAGHFPDFPLVPGIVQIEMARLTLEKVLARPLSLKQVVKSKFTGQVHPEKTVEVRGAYQEVEEGWEMDVEVHTGGKKVASLTARMIRQG